MSGPVILSKIRTLWSYYPGLLAGICAILLFIVFKFLPVLPEVLYRGFFYQIFKFVWDRSLALLPFPLVFMTAPLLIYCACRAAKKLHRKGVKTIWILPDLVGRAIAIFLLVWGYNYACRPVDSAVNERMQDKKVFDAAVMIIDELNTSPRSRDMEEKGSVMTEELEQIYLAAPVVFGKYNIPCWGRPIPKTVPFGLLRKLGITGIYFPYSSEPHVDGSLLRMQQIFVAAHEMAHAYGIAGEGEADYAAFQLLLHECKQPEIAANFRYCALLELLRSIRNRLHVSSPHLKEELNRKQGEQLNADLEAIRQNSRLHQEWMPGMQEAMNDRYLKTMGVNAGTASYDEFIELALRSLILR